MVNVDPKEVEEIIRILQSGSDVERLNAKLAPHGVSIEYNDEILQSGAAGGYTGDKLVINPNKLHLLQQNAPYMRTLISHELVHKGQMDRVRQAGQDPVAIANKISDKYGAGKEGPVDVAAYTEEPIEAMALAKNAVDSMRRSGVDVQKGLRRGDARYHSPVPIHTGGKRFHKYAYQYAQERP